MYCMTSRPLRVIVSFEHLVEAQPGLVNVLNSDIQKQIETYRQSLLKFYEDFRHSQGFRIPKLNRAVVKENYQDTRYNIHILFFVPSLAPPPKDLHPHVAENLVLGSSLIMVVCGRQKSYCHLLFLRRKRLEPKLGDNFQEKVKYMYS